MDPVAQSGRFLAPSDKLGKYDLVRQIAVGGMAELYLARTVGLEGFEKLVVLKRILPQYVTNANFVNMFLNEARLVATLQHPNIAQVFDIDQDGVDYFFSMEYVHGQDLGQVVASAQESGVPISLDAALTVIAGLCAGLHYAHEKVGPDGVPLQVVHRDVSPSNVLVSYDGAVKLTDFGIARSGTNGTTRGGLKGKIAYMSPEQCRGKVALDRRSDVFSVGTILYELTAGRLPFTDETEYGILNQIVNRDVEPPGRFVPDYSPALSAIVMRAMARNPDQRFATALELQKALEDFALEHRVRVSPIVVGRLMGTLYPTRLEEWDHARAQGAFFVEQHIVRTLAETSRASDLHDRVDAQTGEQTAVGDDTSVTGQTNAEPTLVGPLPTEEQTSVRQSPVAGYPLEEQTMKRPLPGVTPVRQPVMRPSQPAMPRAASPRYDARVEPEPLPISIPQARMPTLPVQPAPMPAPSIPNAVPIMSMGMPMADSMPPSTVLTPPPSGLESAARHARVYPVASAIEVAERPQRGKKGKGPAETMMIRVPRSKMPLLLAAIGVMVAAILVTVIVIKVSANEQPRVAAPVAEPPKPTEVVAPEPVKVEAKAEPVKPDEPAKVEPAPAGAANPEKTAQPEQKTAQPEPAQNEPATTESPTTEVSAEPPKTETVTKKTKTTRPKSKQPKVANKKDAAKKSDAAADSKEQKWDVDSPVMPTRPEQK